MEWHQFLVFGQTQMYTPLFPNESFLAFSVCIWIDNDKSKSLSFGFAFNLLLGPPLPLLFSAHPTMVIPISTMASPVLRNNFTHTPLLMAMHRHPLKRITSGAKVSIAAAPRRQCKPVGISGSVNIVRQRKRLGQKWRTCWLQFLTARRQRTVGDTHSRLTFYFAAHFVFFKIVAYSLQTLQSRKCHPPSKLDT